MSDIEALLGCRYSPSMRSPFSGQFQPPGLAPGQMLDNTVGFVQRQGSFHSDHAIQHLMTDHPYTDPSPETLRKNTSHTSLPSQQSFHHHHSAKSLPGGTLSRQDLAELPQWSVHHGRDSVHSMHHPGSEPRQSIQTESTDEFTKRSATLQPASISSRLSVQSQPVSNEAHLKPPLAYKQNIASSALFQSTPVSPPNGFAAPGHNSQGHSDHAGQHMPFIGDRSFASQHDAYGTSPYSIHGPSAATQHDFRQAHVSTPIDGFAQQDAQTQGIDHHQQPQQQQQQQQQSTHVVDADAVLNSALQSADSFGDEMLTTDINQTQHWGKSMLARMPQLSEEPEKAHNVLEQDCSAAATAAAAMPSSALQSADSFGDEMLTTDLNQTQHWGKSMLDHTPQVPETQQLEEDVGSSASKPAVSAVHAVHAVPLTMTAEGIHPPVRQVEDGPHDWLWLPDELSTINDSPLSSAQDSRPDIHAWLSQQQATRLAKHAQHGSSEFKGDPSWQPAVSPTSPLNTADSMNSTFDDHQMKPYTSLGWTQDLLPLPPDNVVIPAAVASQPGFKYTSAPQPSNTAVPQPHVQTPAQIEAPSPTDSEPPSRTWSPARTTSPAPQETPQASPFARWSSTPILGLKAEPAAPLSSPNSNSQLNSTPQHAQQHQQVPAEAAPARAQAEEEVHDRVPASDVKQQELSNRLAALDSLGSLDAAEAFEAFGSPVQAKQASPEHLPDSSSQQAEHEASSESVYDTLAPLPVHVPGATLSAPEEALLATMQEILNDAAGYSQDDIRQTISSSLATSDSLSFPTKPSPAPAICVNDDVTFPLTPTATATIPRAASNSPEGFSPTTPDQLPGSSPACSVNPISSFRSILSTQERQPRIDAISSYHQLLMTQELSKQERLSKFHQLLASQEIKKDGEPLVSLAGRVSNMAAQLDALQKRTQELQAASSPSRRVNSPFRGRASPIRGADGRRSPSASPRAAASASDSPQPGTCASNSPEAGATASNSPQPGAPASNSSDFGATANNSPSTGAAAGGSPAGSSRGICHSGEVEASPRSLTSRIARISQRFEQPTAGA